MSGRIGADYEIIRELRRGPWVTVYEARHRVLGRRALVKWLNPEHEGDEEMAGRLKREARLGAAVDHPNAARIYGVGEADGRPYVAIEWIEGEDLEALMQRENPLSFDRVARLVQDLLNGLTAIHNAGVVHRDLSPANVRITENGKARITDFGLATGKYDPRFTMPGSVVGTPGYLAPEQAAGKEIDQRADLFAVGVLLHECLTGKPLFRDKDLITTVKRVRTEPAPPIDDQVENLPPGFGNWLDKFLVKDPELRWQNAAVALDSFKEIVRELEQAEEEIQPSQDKPWIRLPATLLPAVVIGLGLALIITALQPSFRSQMSPPDLVIESLNDLPDSLFRDSMEHRSPSTETPERNQASVEPSEHETQSMRTTSTEDAHQQRDIGRHEEAGRDTRDTPVVNRISERQPEPVIAGKGILIVHTSPWAEVYLNGTRYGTTPHLEPISCEAGDISLTFDNPGFPPITFDTTIIAEDTTIVHISLASRVGTISLTVIPWAHVFIDDVPLGDTPLGRPVYLSPGMHEIRLNHPEFGIYRNEFIISPGQVREVAVNMVEQGTPFADPHVRRSP